MTSWLATSLLSLLLLSGCCSGAPWPVELLMDEQWSEVELNAIQLALDEWLLATGAANYTMVLNQPHGLDMDTWRDAPHRVHRLHEGEPATITFRREHPYWGGITSTGETDGGSIAIAIDYIGDDKWLLKHIMLHELGHLYGFCGHHPNTLMDGDSSRDLDCIDTLVLDEVCDSHECVNQRTTCH